MTQDDITSFVNGLGNDFIQQNTPEVVEFLRNNFRDPLMNRWYGQGQNVLRNGARSAFLDTVLPGLSRALGPTQDPQQEAIQMLSRAINARRPGTVGASRLFGLINTPY